jgi:hypothetical protein
VSVQLGGHQFEVPAQPAAWWLSMLMDPNSDLLDLFPGCLDDAGQDVVNDLLFEGVVPLEDLHKTVLDIVGTNAARDWWVVFRLVEVARISWHTIGAEMLSRGVDPDEEHRPQRRHHVRYEARGSAARSGGRGEGTGNLRLAVHVDGVT